MSNEVKQVQQGRFVKARNGVRLDHNIDGCIVFPHRAGKQPGENETFTYEFAFRVKDKTIIFVKCFDKVEDAVVPQPEATVQAEVSPVQTDVTAQADVAPAQPPVSTQVAGADVQSKPAGQRRERNQGGRHQGGQRHGGNRQDGERQGSNENHGDRRGNQKQGKRPHKGDRKDRDNRKDQGGRKDNGSKGTAPIDNTGRTWSFGSTAVAKPVVKPAVAADSIARAEAIVKFDPNAKVDQSNLLAAWAQKKAQGDQVATALRASMSAVLEKLAALNDQAAEPSSILASFGEKASGMAVRLHGLRQTMENLKKKRSTLSGERLALSNRGKRLEAAGDKADSVEVTAVAELKETFAARQATLALEIKSVKEILDGAPEAFTDEDRGLEHHLYCEVAGLLPLDEAEAEKDKIMKAVSDGLVIGLEARGLTLELAQLVNDYEKRINGNA